MGMRMGKGMSAFEKKDKAADKKAGIKENTPQDVKIDARAMSPQMLRAIKMSPKGKLPPSLMKKRSTWTKKVGGD